MFFCEKCRKERNWPESLFKSFGSCEVCGNSAQPCHDVKSSLLPLPESSNVMSKRYQTISILPTGLYNNALRNQGLPLEIINDPDKPGEMLLHATDDKQATDHIGALVNRVCELDTILGLVVQSNADKLSGKATELRQLFQDGDIQVSGTISAAGASGNYEDDDFDDFIAQIRDAVDSIRKTITDHYKQVQS
jgi:hypothetical protein